MTLALVNIVLGTVLATGVSERKPFMFNGIKVIGVKAGWTSEDVRLVEQVTDLTIPAAKLPTGNFISTFDGTRVLVRHELRNKTQAEQDETIRADAQTELLANLFETMKALTDVVDGMPPGQVPQTTRTTIMQFKDALTRSKQGLSGLV